MGEIFVRSFFLARNQAAFDKALEYFIQGADIFQSDPNVIAYAVCTVHPDQSGAIRNNFDPLTILITERYVNEAARSRASVSKSASVTDDDQSLFKSQETITSEAEVTFTRVEQLARVKDPYIVTASFLYDQGRAQEAMEGWRTLVDYVEQNEDETYTYSVFKQLDSLSTFEVYHDKEYVQSVHLKSPAIAANNAQNGQWRTPNQTFATKWLVKGGFLYKL